MHIPTDSTHLQLLKEPHLPLPSTVSTAARGFSSQVLTLQALQFLEIKDKHPV